MGCHSVLSRWAISLARVDAASDPPKEGTFLSKSSVSLVTADFGAGYGDHYSAVQALPSEAIAVGINDRQRLSLIIYALCSLGIFGL